MSFHKSGRNDAETPGASVDKGLGGPAKPGCAQHPHQAQGWCGVCQGMPVVVQTQDVRLVDVVGQCLGGEYDTPHDRTPAPVVDTTLAERGKRYGSFVGHSEVTQSLKLTMSSHAGWGRLAADQKEALEMIAHKIGRVLNGDPNYADSWHDIAGYAALVDKRLRGEVL